MEELRQWNPITGVPQGAVLSPVLSNLYLNPLDHQMADAGFEMVRYADDFVVLCRSQTEAEEALAMITAWVEESGSIETIAKELSRTLVGWFGYFRHCRWTICYDLDLKIRRRLRRLLLKRHRKNPERLPRNQRWPNAYFTKAGLYSLREAHFRFAQSDNY